MLGTGRQPLSPPGAGETGTRTALRIAVDRMDQHFAVSTTMYTENIVSNLQDENTANIEKAKSLTAGHLDTIASSIAAARAKGIIGNGPFCYGWLSSWFMRSMEPPPKRKFKAAKVYTPSPDVDAAKAYWASLKQPDKQKLVSWLIQVDYRFTHWRSHG